MPNTRAHQKQLLRQFEAALRKDHGVRDMRWQLRLTGMTEDQVWGIELPIRRRIREERSAVRRTLTTPSTAPGRRPA